METSESLFLSLFYIVSKTHCFAAKIKFSIKINEEIMYKIWNINDDVPDIRTVIRHISGTQTIRREDF